MCIALVNKLISSWQSVL